MGFRNWGFLVECADCMHAIVVIGDGCGAMVGDWCEKCLLLRMELV